MASAARNNSVDDADELGYRAIHVVAMTQHAGIGERLAEIQIRTRIQEAWAQTVERVDEILSSDLKHGDGPAEWVAWFLDLSDAFVDLEQGKSPTMPTMPAFPPPS